MSLVNLESAPLILIDTNCYKIAHPERDSTILVTLINSSLNVVYKATVIIKHDFDIAVRDGPWRPIAQMFVLSDSNYNSLVLSVTVEVNFKATLLNINDKYTLEITKQNLSEEVPKTAVFTNVLVQDNAIKSTAHKLAIPNAPTLSDVVTVIEDAYYSLFWYLGHTNDFIEAQAVNTWYHVRDHTQLQYEAEIAKLNQIDNKLNSVITGISTLGGTISTITTPVTITNGDTCNRKPIITLSNLGGDITLFDITINKTVGSINSYPFSPAGDSVVSSLLTSFGAVGFKCVGPLITYGDYLVTDCETILTDNTTYTNVTLSLDFSIRIWYKASYQEDFSKYVHPKNKPVFFGSFESSPIILNR